MRMVLSWTVPDDLFAASKNEAMTNRVKLTTRLSIIFLVLAVSTYLFFSFLPVMAPSLHGRPRPPVANLISGMFAGFGIYFWLGPIILSFKRQTRYVLDRRGAPGFDDQLLKWEKILTYEIVEHPSFEHAKVLVLIDKKGRRSRQFTLPDDKKLVALIERYLQRFIKPIWEIDPSDIPEVENKKALEAPAWFNGLQLFSALLFGIVLGLILRMTSWAYPPNQPFPSSPTQVGWVWIFAGINANTILAALTLLTAWGRDRREQVLMGSFFCGLTSFAIALLIALWP